MKSRLGEGGGGDVECNCSKGKVTEIDETEVRRWELKLRHRKQVGKQGVGDTG